jgi:hypothetical protein
MAWPRAWSARSPAIVDPKHCSSQRVLTKIGMQQIGHDHILGRDWIVYEAQRGRAR